MKRLTDWPLIISTSAVLMVVLFFTEAPFSAVVSLGFLLICPGMAFVRLLRIAERMTEVLLAIAFSIAIATIVSETMLLAGIWSPKLGLLTLVGIALSGVAIEVVHPLGRKSDTLCRE